jgi:AraC-like DNA-binding protein
VDRAAERPQALPLPAQPHATAHDAVFTLVRTLVGHGVSGARISEATGIDPALLDDPDARVPVSQFERLWQFAAQQLRQPAIALDLHERYPDNRMHFVAHLGMRCPDMRTAIDHWRKYARLVCEIDLVDYEVQGASARFLYRCLDHRHASHWFAEHYLSLALFYARTFTGEDLRVREACFEHADPGHAKDYERCFGVKPQFGAAHNALVFDADYLDLPFRTADPYLRHFLSARADDLLGQMELPQEMQFRAWQAVALLLAKGEPLTLARTAQALALGERQLRSALSREGVSLRDIVAGVRREAAERYLKQGLTVSQVAYLSGFSDASAFQHACKRWFNASAGALRSGRRRRPT